MSLRASPHTKFVYDAVRAETTYFCQRMYSRMKIDGDLSPAGYWLTYLFTPRNVFDESLSLQPSSVVWVINKLPVCLGTTESPVILNDTAFSGCLVWSAVRKILRKRKPIRL